jgi:pimeloyl-ACP methyl ester carboxylesterase
MDPVDLARAARPAWLSATIITVILVVATLAAVIAQDASARAASAHSSGTHAVRLTSATKPVIVLEHGAWADASSWDKVTLQLEQDGYTVYAPPNPLRGLPQDSAYLHDFLTQNAALAGQPVVLVGHSYGGAVITNAAVGDPEVKALVYVDAFIPDQNETLLQLTSAKPGSCLGGNPANVFDFAPYPGGPAGDVDTYIKPSLVPGCFASGLPASQAAVIAATQRPLAASTLQEPSGTPAWKTIPSWAVIGTADLVLPPAEQTFMAQRAGAHITDVNAGHLSMISDPETVAQVIEQAAQVTS